jgi:hypothetical protein
MTVEVNGHQDVLTTQEVWDLCRAHTALGLTTDQVGRLYVGESINPEELEAEVRAIMAYKPTLTDACHRVLAALHPAG